MPVKDFFDTEQQDGGEPYVGRECYVFNERLAPADDDTACIHCAKFMTLRCEYINEFINED